MDAVGVEEGSSAYTRIDELGLALNLHAAECVTQQHDHCLAHRAIALRLRVGMPAEACLGAVLLQNMHKGDLHARAGIECHALQRVESREPSAKVLQQSSLATVEQRSELGLFFGVVFLAVDLRVVVPSVEAKHLAIQREHHAVGGALGGNCTVPKSVAKLIGDALRQKEKLQPH